MVKQASPGRVGAAGWLGGRCLLLRSGKELAGQFGVGVAGAVEPFAVVENLLVQGDGPGEVAC